jgi:hypothetical protein
LLFSRFPLALVEQADCMSAHQGSEAGKECFESLF